MPSRTVMTDDADQAQAPPLGGTRAQALQRLQVGASLLIGIILIVGLANVIENRAKQSDQTVVPQAAATVAPDAAQATTSDPLADAGVVPDLPAEPGPPPAGTTGEPRTGPDAGQ